MKKQIKIKEKKFHLLGWWIQCREVFRDFMDKDF